MKKVVPPAVLVGVLVILVLVVFLARGDDEEGAKAAPSPTAVAATPIPTPVPTVQPIPATPTRVPTPTFIPTSTPTLAPTPTRPAPTPASRPIMPTLVPATPVLQASMFEAVKKNEIVSFPGEVLQNEEIMPGATPKQFHVRLGGCGCMRSLTVEVKKLNSRQGGDLQEGIRLGSTKGKVVSEGQEFFVPHTGISAFVFIWADPGTKLGSFERITAWMKEEGAIVDSVILAENVEIPESLPILSQVYQSLGDRATGFVRIRNLSPWSQTVHNLQVNNCNFPTIGTARFSQSGDIVIQPGQDLILNIDITIPPSVRHEGVVFCEFTFERKKEVLTLDHR